MKKTEKIEEGDIVVDKSPYGIDENDVVLIVVGKGMKGEVRCKLALYHKIRHTCMINDVKKIGITTEKHEKEMKKLRGEIKKLVADQNLKTAQISDAVNHTKKYYDKYIEEIIALKKELNYLRNG